MSQTFRNQAFRRTYNIILLYSLLALPKLALSSSGLPKDRQGILLGEILLTFSFFVNFSYFSQLSRNKFAFPRVLLYFYAFLCTYVCFSSLFSSIHAEIFPYDAVSQFIRVSIYMLIPIAYVQYISVQGSLNSSFWYRIFRDSYLFHGMVALALFLYYNFKLNPGINDMLWSYDVGNRLIPMMGLALDFSGDNLFYPIGGGSGNLFATWSLFFAIMCLRFEVSRVRRIVYCISAFALVILSQSRGGVLTLSLLYIYHFIFDSTIPKPYKAFIFGVGVAILSYFLATIIAVNEENNYLPILNRFQTSYADGELDASSADRLVNYENAAKAWISNPIFTMFGLGIDSSVLQKLTGWSLVESFYLSVLFSGGLISLFLFFNFLAAVSKRRRLNEWYSLLFQFLLFNSLINWTITGGDLLSVAGLFPIVTLCSLGFIKGRMNENTTNR